MSNTKPTIKNNRIWTKDEIKNLILTNDKMVIRSVLKLYEYQTESEKLSYDSNIINGVGFNSFDAPFLTDIVKKIHNNVKLTKNQIFILRKKMLKYSNQLTRIANKEI